MSRMDPEDARQGKKGTPVLRVLISALILCAIVAVGMAIYGWAMPDATIGSDVGTSIDGPIIQCTASYRYLARCVNRETAAEAAARKIHNVGG